MNYPYYIAVMRSGRLETPLQYRHTPIEKMFKSGKIGGTKSQEITSENPKEIQTQGFIAERAGKTVEVYCVESPNRPRRMCPGWRHHTWNGLE